VRTSLTITASTVLALGIVISGAATVAATDPGTAYLVKDIYPGQSWSDEYGEYVPNSSDPDYLTDAAGTLFFAATGPGGRELYTSDGTSDGTVRLNVRTGSKSATPLYITAIGSNVFFSAIGTGGLGRELWMSDGTQGGTHLAADINPGSNSSEPRYLTAMGGKLYFSANGGGGRGRELWVSDGTPGGTHIVRDIRAGKKSSDPQEITAVGNRIFFRAATPVNSLWSSDGTEAGTVNIPITGVEDVFELTRVGTQLFFVSEEAPDGPYSGRQTVRVVHPSAQTSTRMMDLPECSDQIYCHYDCGDSTCRFGFDLTAVGDLLFFATTTDKLWRSDGTKAGTFKVTNLFGCNVNQGVCAKSFTDVGGTLFFVAPRWTYSGPNGEYQQVSTEVWKSNGTAAGTAQVKVMPPYGPFYEPGPCPAEPKYCANYVVGASAALEGQYYFSGPDGYLWQSDGTADGTKRACAAQDPCPQYPRHFTVSDSSLYVTGDDFDVQGRELWHFNP
jgi:ELWxxDGT repeat protein